MSSVTGKTVCPECGATNAITYFESKTTASFRVGVVCEQKESSLHCPECGYSDSSVEEFHEDGRWYRRCEEISPVPDRPVTAVSESKEQTGVGQIKECPVLLRNDGTIIPIDPESMERLYDVGDGGVLIPVKR